MKKINLYLTIIALVALFVGCDKGADMAVIKEKQQRAIDSTAAAKIAEVRTNLLNGCNQSIEAAIKMKADSTLAALTAATMPSVAGKTPPKTPSKKDNNKPSGPSKITPPPPPPAPVKTDKDRSGAIKEGQMAPAQQKDRTGAVKTGGTSTTPGSSVAPSTNMTPTQQKQRSGATKVEDPK